MIGHEKLAEHLKELFLRQIEWFEQRREQLSNIEKEMDVSDLDDLVAGQRKDEHTLAAFSEEFGKLAEAWQQAGERIPDDKRKEVRQLAQRADSLARQLHADYQQAEKTARKRLDALGDARSSLRRGRVTLDKYRPGNWDQAGLIDRKA